MNKHLALPVSALRLVLAPLAMSVLALASPACSDGTTEDDGATDGGSGGTTTDGPPIASYCEPAGSCPVDASGADLTAPVSFEADVMPIFQASCNDTLCHGDRTRARGDLWLGPEEGETASAEDLDTIVSTLTGKGSELNTDLKNVVPGDWENSFLMHKVDGCQNDLGLDCDESLLDSTAVCGESCGDGMPQDEDLYALTEDERNTIRAWIAQGAENN